MFITLLTRKLPLRKFTRNDNFFHFEVRNVTIFGMILLIWDMCLSKLARVHKTFSKKLKNKVGKAEENYIDMYRKQYQD